MTVLAFLLGLVDPVTRIANQIAAARVAQANAATDREKIAAEERVAALEARRAALVAESGSRVNAIVRAAFALPFAIYNAKLVVWDKVFGLGTTDPLSDELFQVEIAVIGFYFLYDIAAKWRRK